MAKGTRARAEEHRLKRMRVVIIGVVACVVLAVLGIGLFMSLKPTELTLEEGRTFRTVSEVPASATGPIKVTEFFSYGCPACATLHPRLEDWVAELPEDVSFQLMPFVGVPAWEVFARGFFAMRDRDLIAANHGRLFAAISERGRNLGTAEQFAEFVADEDAPALARAMNGLRVERAMQRADRLARQLAIVSVPTLVVDDRYVVVGQGASIDALRVADMLIDKVRRERHESPNSESPNSESPNSEPLNSDPLNSESPNSESVDTQLLEQAQ